MAHAHARYDRRTGDYLWRSTNLRAEDVVLDLATGSEIIATPAARAAARRVYEVEATNIAEIAERVFTATPRARPLRASRDP